MVNGYRYKLLISSYYTLLCILFILHWRRPVIADNDYYRFAPESHDNNAQGTQQNKNYVFMWSITSLLYYFTYLRRVTICVSLSINALTAAVTMFIRLYRVIFQACSPSCYLLIMNEFKFWFIEFFSRYLTS